MLTYDHTPTIHTATELAAARDRLTHAATEVDALRTRARAIAAATDWQARSAAGFRAAITGLIDRLDRLAVSIAVADGDLAHTQDRVLGIRGWYGR